MFSNLKIFKIMHLVQKEVQGDHVLRLLFLAKSKTL